MFIQLRHATHEGNGAAGALTRACVAFGMYKTAQFVGPDTVYEGSVHAKIGRKLEAGHLGMPMKAVSETSREKHPALREEMKAEIVKAAVLIFLTSGHRDVLDLFEYDPGSTGMAISITSTAKEKITSALRDYLDGFVRHASDYCLGLEMRDTARRLIEQDELRGVLNERTGLTGNDQALVCDIVAVWSGATRRYLG